MGGFLFGRTIGLLTRNLDLRAAEQRAIVSNIANNETPGYRARDVDFGELLDGAMDGATPRVRLVGTHPAHFGASRGPQEIKMVERPVGETGLDRNTVDIEDEMGRLSGNYMMYNLTTRLLKKKFSMIMTAIKEGGR